MNHSMLHPRKTDRTVGRSVRLLAPVMMAITVLLASSACTTAQSGTAAVESVPSAAADDGNAATPPPAPAASSDGVNACSLLTGDEVKAIIGTNSGAKGGVGECAWENEDNYHSVTVDIGQPGTAVNGKLPDPLPGAKIEAGPDGIRFSSGNVAEFLIGDRACQVQVVTSVTDESDRPAQVKIIGLIRGRLKG